MKILNAQHAGLAEEHIDWALLYLLYVSGAKWIKLVANSKPEV